MAAVMVVVARRSPAVAKTLVSSSTIRALAMLEPPVEAAVPTKMPGESYLAQ